MAISTWWIFRSRVHRATARPNNGARKIAATAYASTLATLPSCVPPGEHTYELVFRTDRQLGYFADHDELYWNVTGNGWDFPIDRVTARVELPQAIPAAEIKLEAYTGPQGAKGQDYTAQMQASGPLFATTRGLRPREGLTIVAMWPKGFIMPPVESARPVGRRAAANYMNDDGRSGWSPAEHMLSRDLPNNGLPALLGCAGPGLC